MGYTDDADEKAGNSFVSRRNFLKRSASLGVSTALSGAGLPQIAGADTETPKRGGHLIIALDGGSPHDSLDPLTSSSIQLQVIGPQIYNTLVDIEVGDDVRLKPMVRPALATSWEPKNGAKEWVFKIRKDVTFHNSKPLTAEDVAYSLNYHRQPEATTALLLESVVSIKVSAPYEVTISLAAGHTDFPYLLADYHLCIGATGSTFTDGVGTGAFILQEFDPGVRIVSRRNPDYFRAEGVFVNSVEIRTIGDPVVRLNALLSGSVHLINRVNPKDMIQLVNDKRLQIFEISGSSHYCFSMRCNRAPFDNHDLRLALKYAIDRQSILTNVLHHHGKLGNDHPVHPQDPFLSPTLAQRPYDPERAKYHLKKSGFTGAIPLNVSDAAFAGAIRCARIFEESAAKAGIKLHVQEEPAESYWENVWMTKPFFASYWNGRPNADLMFSAAYTTTAAWNETYWQRPDFDKLLAAARAELDFGKRKNLYYQLQAMLYDDGGVIIPVFNNTIDAASVKVKGFVPVPSSALLGGFRAPEKIWLDT
ncbi:MAG: ABC transporter substrate-binding protein [Gammaproteobacteria bacterium]|nr:ABC transporter substrate-binding protein [Gammaproteobacteria bacterium]